MTTYSVWAPKADSTAERAVFVAHRFSWGAVIFTALWALWHRHYLLAVGLALVFGVVEVLALGVNPLLPGLLANLLALWLGLEAATLRDWLYEKRGFRFLGEVPGANADEAELRFFASRTTPAPKAPPPPIVARPAPADLLGLFSPGGA
ncbi:MAG TPA: DUF2628 domain-containing protein [Aestuariivirga sp.]|nr:DUF2628 domain-containing protein [Aestuariivirga sp.]